MLDKIDWLEVEREIVESLRRYIQYKTINPPGNVSEAVDYLCSLLIQEGITPKIFEPYHGKKILVARVSGKRNDAGIIMLSHSDVVGAESGWSVNPFAGEVSNGFIWGRGTLDMKGMGIMQLWTLILLKRYGHKPLNDIILIVVPDEESGGFQGAEWLTQNHPEECRARYLINEGGMGIQLADKKQNVFLCSTGEKGPVWLTVSARGQAGHSAIPINQNALEILMMALARLFATKPEIKINPLLNPIFKLLEVAAEGKLDYSHLTNRLYLRPQLANTISLTMLHSGTKQNVIPEMAVATLDCRLLPGQDIEEFINDIKHKLGDNRIEIKIDVLREASSSKTDSPFWKIINHTIAKHFQGSLLCPYFAPYFTDSMFFRKLGIIAYGLIPILIDEDEIVKIHGFDERISVANLVQGTKALTEIVFNTSILKEESE